MSESSVQMRRSPVTELQRRRRVTGGVRAKKRKASSPGVRSGPDTPLLKWKLDVTETAKNGTTSTVPVVLSARKLAASIWRLGFETDPSNVQKSKPRDDLKTINHSKTKEILHNYISHENEIYAESPHSTTETATKWDTGDVQSFYQQKLVEYKPNQTTASISFVYADLDEARARVNELEAERRHTRKKLDHFLRKIQEEKSSWRNREHEKIKNIIECAKEEMNRERKNRNRLEILNSKLVNELSDTKITAKRYLQDYEKERKARELMEEVCDELAKEIADDKSEMEALKLELLKTREEIEEERRMLQMAEVWREERVQMKLIDAKLTLENKYNELVSFKSLLEAFVKTNLGNHGVEREARALIDAVNKVKVVNEMKEFKYQPPRESEDIFSVFEDLRPQEGDNNCDDNNNNNNSDTNGYSSESPDTDIFLEKREIDDEERENESGWETVSNLDEHGSSNSNEGSEPSVNNAIYKRNKSNNESTCTGTGTGTDWDEKSEVCSTNDKPSSKKKGNKIMRLWRSNNGEDCKKISSDLISNGRVSNASVSPDLKSRKAGSGLWSSPESVNNNNNPHVSRGMNGFVEWKRAKQSLKSKLEARIEGKKVQLKHALKQKI